MKLSAPIYQLKRRAKLLARDENVPLHSALDRVARDEGFAGWSLLSARVATGATASEMLSRLSDGDMLLLGARPGHGKTLLGLQLLLDAIRDGRRGVFFTLEYTEQETHARIRWLEGETSDFGAALEIATSDEICAEYIMRHLDDASRGTVAVIDYLQILDQRRNKPELLEQITALQKFARKTGTILAFISQIDRSYDPEAKPLPDMQDIRLPNKVDVGLFSKACFLHEGKAQFRAIA
ncbi:DNA helicase [Aureimonas altamirensis]|uniref:DNA helicase n=1 Tax=Aureimonas altamirensis TaxID=370622 RepID=A0A0B1Q2U2_9HYPH|nr:DNA helicase [Aureimonas altamirensis]KHJ53237.1 DNA helicase [Aureimonas altamirensis]